MIITDQFVERGLGALTDRVRAAVCALILSSVLKLRKTTIVDPATAVLFAVVFLLSAASVFFTFENPVVTFFTSPVVLVVAAGVAGLCIRGAKGALNA